MPTRARLAALLGSDADVNRFTHEARSNLMKSRTLEIKDAHDAVGAAEIWLLLVAGPKVNAVRFTSGDESLRPFTADLATVELPNPFADATDAGGNAPLRWLILERGPFDTFEPFRKMIRLAPARIAGRLV